MFGESGSRRDVRHHDIATLFDSVKKNFEAINDESIAHVAQVLDVEKALVSTYFPAMLLKLKKITDKYYFYEFLSSDEGFIEVCSIRRSEISSSRGKSTKP